jgi:hypothetical protein
MGDLTEAAKAEIAAAIAIVREDRFEKYVRASISRPAPADPTKDDPIFDPEKDPAVPPRPSRKIQIRSLPREGSRRTGARF